MERNDHCWCPPTIQPGESWKAIDLISSPLLCAPKNQDSEQTMPTTSNSLWDLQSSSLPKHEPPEVAWTKLCQSFMFFHILRHFKITKWYTDRAHDPHSSSISHSCRRKAVHSFGTFSVILRVENSVPPASMGWKSVGLLLGCACLQQSLVPSYCEKGIIYIMKSNLTNTRLKEHLFLQAVVKVAFNWKHTHTHTPAITPLTNPVKRPKSCCGWCKLDVPLCMNWWR